MPKTSCDGVAAGSHDDRRLRLGEPDVREQALQPVRSLQRQIGLLSLNIRFRFDGHLHDARVQHGLRHARHGVVAAPRQIRSSADQQRRHGKSDPRPVREVFDVRPAIADLCRVQPGRNPVGQCVCIPEGSEHAPRTSRAAKAGTSCVVFIAYSVNCIAAMIVLLALTIGQRRRDSQTLGREPHSKARLTSWPPLAISRASRFEQGSPAMSRRCQITGKGVLTGNNVSHANNKTRRRFLPNLQETSLLSDMLGLPVRMRLSTRAIRTIEHNGGIDAYLLGTPERRPTVDAKALKRRLLRAQAKRTASQAV